MKKLKKIAKIAALVLGTLIALLLLTNAVLIWITGRCLEGRIQAIRAAGDPVTLNDLARPPLPPEQNAAVFLRRAEDDLKALEKELSHVNHTPASPHYEEGPLTEDDRKTLRSAFAAYPKVVALLEQAAACPDYDAEMDYTVGPQALLEAFLPRYQYAREVARVLDVRVRLLLAEGDQPEALRTSLVLWRLVHHFDRQPLLLTFLVTTAVRMSTVATTNRVLRAGPLPDKSRDALDAELATNEGLEGYLHALKTDRAYVIASYGTIIPVNWANRAYFNNDECHVLDWINEQLALASHPYADVAAWEDQFKNQEDLRGHFALSKLQMASIVKPRQIMDSDRARVRCLRVLNALQRQHYKPQAEEMPRIADLGLPAEATTDPFNGEPLHLKVVDKEWVVYAVGTNLIDDGGELSSPYLDVGVGPIESGKK